jgi:hypothetical protein
MGKAPVAFWPSRDREGGLPAAREGGSNSVARQACRRVQAVPGSIECGSTVMLLRIRKVTGAACGAVGFGVFARVLWEWWVGEKKKRASNAAGASSGGGQERQIDGHAKTLS